MTPSEERTNSQPDTSGESATPGKPKDSGSRQQTHKDQSSQTGSPQSDREHSDRGGSATAPKPPGAK
jgi:hypothetical protein